MRSPLYFGKKLILFNISYRINWFIELSWKLINRNREEATIPYGRIRISSLVQTLICLSQQCRGQNRVAWAVQSSEIGAENRQGERLVGQLIVSILIFSRFLWNKNLLMKVFIFLLVEIVLAIMMEKLYLHWKF